MDTLRTLLNEDNPRLPQALPSAAFTAADGISNTKIIEKLAFLRGKNFDEVGFAACTLANLYLRLPDISHTIDFSDLWLQGSPHHTTTPISAAQKQKFFTALCLVLSSKKPALISSLEAIPVTTPSCVHGNDAYWQAARRWAQELNLRIELQSQIPEDSSWHFEDILDASITDASTEVLKDFPETLQSRADVMADIWDGVNDGCWDQVLQHRDVIDTLQAPDDLPALAVSLRGSHLQRASLANADVSTWDFSGSDLLLADMRSCQNILQSNIADAQWWVAMLPPMVRYELSRHETRPEFKAWCATPPWQNPYYQQPWPTPLS